MNIFNLEMMLGHGLRWEAEHSLDRVLLFHQGRSEMDLSRYLGSWAMNDKHL